LFWHKTIKLIYNYLFSPTIIFVKCIEIKNLSIGLIQIDYESD